MLKQRFQAPVPGDTIRLRMLIYSSNLLSNVQSVDKVEIYFINESGRFLVETIDGSAVVNEAEGKYYYDLPATIPAYVIGKYEDVWTVTLEEETEPVIYENSFEISPRLWYTSPVPIVHDFSFRFTPNRIAKGSIKPIIIQIIPQTPTSTELQRYYTNVAIYSDLSITIVKKCDPCDNDLNIIAEDELIEDREKCKAFYQLDTTEMDCGLYDVSFKLEFGGNTYISDRNQLLIY